MKTIENRRQVFLFGAGSTLCWNSPTTWELTQLVRTSGFKTKDNGTYITEFIFQTLLSKGYSEQDANFETIISVLEELVIYYSKFNADKKIPSLLSCFFNPVLEDGLLNFSIRGGGKAEHNYFLDIPAGQEYYLAKPSQHNETPEQFFFQHLLADILGDINDRISKYAYHTASHSSIDCDSNVSNLFVKWMQRLCDDNAVLRLYTLNYERLFKVLMERNRIPVFEGFDTEEYVDYGRYIRPNVRRILSDDDCHVHYNLHGSAFWEVYELDYHLLPNAEIVLTYFPVLPLNDSPASFQVEKGKTLLVTNIITGYQKAQKSMLTPFKQMQSSFDKDCCFADTIYVIGYSFGDEHINASLKSAVRFNSNLKVVIVDPAFMKNNMDFQLMITLFAHLDKQMTFDDRKKVKDNLYSYYQDKFLVHTLTFEEFLMQQTQQ